MSSPFFSIVTPVRNASAFLDTFFQSIYSQTFSEWELIIVNDNSEDETTFQIRRFIALDSRVQYFEHFPPCFRVNDVPGPYAPRNYALRYCRGQYVCFHDVDDYWLPNKLMEQYKVLSLMPYVRLLYSNYYTISGSKLDAAPLQRKVDLSLFPPKTQIFFSNPFPNLTVCVCRSEVSNLQFQPLPHEDYIFWRQVVSKLNSSQIYKSPTYLAAYRIHSDSFSGNKFKVLPWWIKCYCFFGVPLPLALFLLLIRVLFFFLEGLLNRLSHLLSTQPPRYLPH